MKKPSDALLKRNSSSGGGKLSALQEKVTAWPAMTPLLWASDASRVPTGLSVVLYTE